jgi:hypothetical protein
LELYELFRGSAYEVSRRSIVLMLTWFGHRGAAFLVPASAGPSPGKCQESRVQGSLCSGTLISFLFVSIK